MLPEAPGRFSTTICWPSSSAMRGWMMRPTKSDAPPGANGTIMRIGLLGYWENATDGGSNASRIRTRIMNPPYWEVARLFALRREVERLGEHETIVRLGRGRVLGG